MLNAQQKQAINDALWKIFDALRGAGARVPHNHILALLVLKYFSDRSQGTHDQHAQAYDHINADSYTTLLNARLESDIGQRIDHALAELEAQNPSLRGVFREISFNSIALGNASQRKLVLSRLLACFNTAELDFRGAENHASEAVAYACDALIGDMAAANGKHGYEFFTPPEVSQLIAFLMRPTPDESICDPCCGSGTLLLTCNSFARESSGHPCRLFGQEEHGDTWALAKINMVLHGEQSARLELGDTLRDPRLLTDGRLEKFDVVVSCPPFNLKGWGHELATHDAYGRYARGIPPRSTGDYAFISHMVETLKPGSGRMVVLVSHGVLFRGGTEQQIREQLLRENLLDAVIGLPAKMLPHTGIPVALFVLRKHKYDNRVLFIDGSRDYQHGKTQNTLREADISRIEDTYQARQDVDGYARAVSLDEILANDCNLSVARYIDTTEEVCLIDLAALRAERTQLKVELESLESKLATFLQKSWHR